MAVSQPVMAEEAKRTEDLTSCCIQELRAGNHEMFKVNGE